MSGRKAFLRGLGYQGVNQAFGEGGVPFGLAPRFHHITFSRKISKNVSFWNANEEGSGQCETSTRITSKVRIYADFFKTATGKMEDIWLGNIILSVTEINLQLLGWKGERNGRIRKQWKGPKNGGKTSKRIGLFQHIRLHYMWQHATS